MGASKPRKRRKRQSSSQRENAPPTWSMPEDCFPLGHGDAISEELSELPNAGQEDTHTANEPVNSSDLIASSPDPAAFLGDDLNLSLFDSIVPSSFSPIPFLNLDQGESSTQASNNLLTLSANRPFDAMEASSENPPDNRGQLDPLIQDLSSILAEPAQANFTNTAPNDAYIRGVGVSYSSPNNALELSSAFRNDHDNLLQMYDVEFCVLPLTSDITVNPFRCQPQTSQGSRLLFHSILALCCQHLDRLTGSYSAEAVKHRSKAAQLLELAVQNEEGTNKFHLLEPILIMFTLDCTLSAIGTWSTHLTRAHSVLQACGGPDALSNPRVRSQVAMLAWWDTTLALISRQGPIMSQTYLDFLIRWEKEDEWSFFDLTGCPRELIMHLFELADLARQKEIASSMRWLNLDMTPIIEAEREITAWVNGFAPLSHTLDDSNEDDEPTESQFDDQQDRYHCAEAWRYALLLYIQRIFKCNDHRQRPPRSIRRLLRLTVDHIRCVRRTSQIQKQLLLPIFLAGSEASDADTHEFVKEYCRYWAEKTRYEMFSSVPVLLQEIWDSGEWWGCVVDRKTKTGSAMQGQVVATQFLFG
ncbi:hypothetical protein FQN54_005588 [Arachnomyces sp. PD_36]|nr:hypothetical protein FQN54_005588 [Arachnomyces sp. PD_36]